MIQHLTQPQRTRKSRHELIILASELEDLQAADFNLWRAHRLARLQELVSTGVEGEEFVFQPEPESDPSTEFDDEGFSVDLSNGCVQYEPIIETANRWAESRDRILEYGAMLLHRNRYMLPIARLEGDEDFQDRYLKNLTSPPKPMFFGRTGYTNKPVFESFTEEKIGPHTRYTGHGVIENHFQPYAGLNQGEIVEMFTSDVDSGAFKERMLRVAANALAEMDRDGQVGRLQADSPVIDVPAQYRVGPGTGES